MHDLNPINYKIHLEPDLNNCKFSGCTEIWIEAAKPVKKIAVNALELAFRSIKVEVDGQFVNCSFQAVPEKEETIIFLPQEMGGRIHVKIDYLGEINNKLAGFYRSKYGPGGDEKYIAVTQFEESDARRVFPCFDHPLKKATFDVEMVIDKKLVALSNGPIIEQTPFDKKKLVKFQKTPKMSTYLLFFGVGEFEFLESTGKVLVRGVTMPGLKKYAHFGLEFGRKALEFCEDYFGIPYPLPKLDLLAIPDFAAGAMENWGAITFRENLFLLFPTITSKAGKERICEVIAHEITHQWFGNLVSPSDWKYLWLNESFATYFGYGIVNHYHPEWDIGDQFLRSETDTALKRDALQETFPVEIPGGEHVIINLSTAPIIYNKGGSILRQVEEYIGKNDFKEGLRYYLKNHAYGSASSHNLWQALEKVSAKPVTKLMKSWIEQPGFPIIEARKDGDKLVLNQKRFTYISNECDQEWLVPITAKVFYKNGNTKKITTLLESKNTTINIGSDAVAYKINYRQTGFYRVRYAEKTNLKELGKRALSKELPPEDRWGLQNDFYALVKSGQTSINEYLGFLSFYANEDAFLPLISIADNLFQAYLIMEDAHKEEIVSTGKSFLEKTLFSIGYEPHPEESHTISILRDQIIVQATLYGSKEVEKFAREKFFSLLKGEKVHPDLMKSVMQVGALDGNNETLEWFKKRLASSESEHERMNVLAALGSFREKSLIEKVQKYILEKVPNRNKFVPIVYMAANPQAIPCLWEWYVNNLQQFEQFHPVHYERVIAAIVPVCGLSKKDLVNEFFKNYLKQKDKAKDAIKLSLERLEINSKMKGS